MGRLEIAVNQHDSQSQDQELEKKVDSQQETPQAIDSNDGDRRLHHDCHYDATSSRVSHQILLEPRAQERLVRKLLLCPGLGDDVEQDFDQEGKQGKESDDEEEEDEETRHWMMDVMVSM